MNFFKRQIRSIEKNKNEQDQHKHHKDNQYTIVKTNNMIKDQKKLLIALSGSSNNITREIMEDNVGVIVGLAKGGEVLFL